MVSNTKFSWSQIRRKIKDRENSSSSLWRSHFYLSHRHFSSRCDGSTKLMTQKSRSSTRDSSVVVRHWDILFCLHFSICFSSSRTSPNYTTHEINHRRKNLYKLFPPRQSLSFRACLTIALHSKQMSHLARLSQLFAFDLARSATKSRELRVLFKKFDVLKPWRPAEFLRFSFFCRHLRFISS